MNAQELFNGALSGVRSQNYECASESTRHGVTQYKYKVEKPDGSIIKCSIGHLIPDGMYSPKLEGSPVDYFFAKDDEEPFKQVVELFGKENQALLKSLQSAHDSMDSFADDLKIRAEYFENRMSGIAKFYRLKYEKPSV